MYQAVIEEEDPSLTVEIKPNFGKTSFLFSALENDQIDIYPEFTGTVLESLVKVPENTQIDGSPESTYQKQQNCLVTSLICAC